MSNHYGVVTAKRADHWPDTLGGTGSVIFVSIFVGRERLKTTIGKTCPRTKYKNGNVRGVFSPSPRPEINNEIGI